MMSRCVGKGNISATIVADSVNKLGTRVTTFELEYPRFIHSELMTHRVFSRNAASSRAIPIDKMIQHIADSPATPIHWGANQPGMQAKVEVEDIAQSKEDWYVAMKQAIISARVLLAGGLHKQIANRVTEPFQMMKTIVTSTEWDNWFSLRNHEDAQPEIHELANCMLQAQVSNRPMKLEPGEWHLPYIKRDRVIMLQPIKYSDTNGNVLKLDEAKMVSASCCAQVSYRKSDDTLDKARTVYQRLVGNEPRHSSPFEHQCTPMESPHQPIGLYFEVGATHIDRNHDLWSGNFRHFIQLRQLIDLKS